MKLDTRRPLADGTYPVQIRVGYGTNIYLATGIYLKKEEWDEVTGLCVGPQGSRINEVLRRMLERIAIRAIELRDEGAFDRMTYAELVAELRGRPVVRKGRSFVEYAETIIAKKTPQTAGNYRTLLAEIDKYSSLADLHLRDIGRDWMEGFVAHMRAEGHAHNTRSVRLTNLKTILHRAEEDGEKVDAGYRKVTVRLDTNTEMRNLTMEEFRKIRDAGLHGKQARYRDAYMLSFYLIGINAADLLTLPRDCIVNGRIRYKRHKTGKTYNIKVEPEALKIIDRYRAKRGALLLDFGGLSVRNLGQRCAYLLNTIVPGATWYSARYSWANFAVDLDIPKDIISECLGHSHGATVTGIYIRYTSDKIDKANRQVIDYVNADLVSGPEQQDKKINYLPFPRR